MKFIITAMLTLLAVTESKAIEFQVIGPCSAEPLFQQNLNRTNSNNVGDLTVEVLETFEIPYQGSSVGINQIYNSPIGQDAIEILSHNEMLAYGWCYEVDGVISELLPNQFGIKTNTKLIRWFYGYAHYLNGNWISQCEKSYERLSPQICASQ